MNCSRSKETATVLVACVRLPKDVGDAGDFERVAAVMFAARHIPMGTPLCWWYGYPSPGFIHPPRPRASSK